MDDEKKVEGVADVGPTDDDKALISAIAPSLGPFEVVRFFRECGDSYRWIAKTGFWFRDAPNKPLTGPQLRRWYETETKCRKINHPQQRHALVCTPSQTKG